MKLKIIVVIILNMIIGFILYHFIHYVNNNITIDKLDVIIATGFIFGLGSYANLGLLFIFGGENDEQAD